MLTHALQMLSHGRRRSRQSVLGGVLGALLVSLLAAASLTPARALETPAPFALIMDADTGEVLFSKEADTPMAPASMSKLMTLLMLFERLEEGSMSPDDALLISEEAWRRGGARSGSSTMFAEVGSRVPVRDILRGIIVQSGNDACIAVAEAIGGTEQEFARMMTARARELGMTQSVFANSTGWPDPNQQMSARDLAILARIIIKEFPQYYAIFAERQFTWNGITQPNRNPLLLTDFEGADGLKTGHTETSGYGLVGSVVRDDRRFVMVINGLPSERARAQEARRLMSLAYTSFIKERLFTAGDQVGTLKIALGKEANVPLVIANDVSAYLHRAARPDLQVSFSYSEPLRAPVPAGAEVGTATILAPGLDPIRVPLKTGTGVEEVGFFGKVVLGLEHLLFASEPASQSDEGAQSEVKAEPQAGKE